MCSTKQRYLNIKKFKEHYHTRKGHNRTMIHLEILNTDQTEFVLYLLLIETCSTTRLCRPAGAPWLAYHVHRGVLPPVLLDMPEAPRWLAMCERHVDVCTVLVHTSETRSRPTCTSRSSSRPSRNHRLVIVTEATCKRALDPRLRGRRALLPASIRHRRYRALQAAGVPQGRHVV
jgi:hypothetical protein